MVSLAWRRTKGARYQRAADGSMTLFEHLQELRSRLFKASLGVVIGLIIALFFARDVLDFLTQPYCALRPGEPCQFNYTSPVDGIVTQLRVALYIGLILAAPVWLYQLWAFIAPGLHRHERKYTYWFVAAATPLFLAGITLAHFVLGKGLKFLLSSDYVITLSLPDYFNFVTNTMLLFGVGFEFPMVVVMLNLTGLVSARRLLSWWRTAVFVMFLFGAIVTPTPDPFGMSILAGAMALLYFAAVGVAFLNDRRRSRRDQYAGLGDDEVSPIDDPREPVEAGTPIAPPTPVSRPQPLDSRYDDST